jgi:hypothetical protein
LRRTPHRWLSGFTLVGQSGNVLAGEGYASFNSTLNPFRVFGSYNYLFDTKSLYLSTSYNSLNVIASNKDLLVAGTNHLGDGDYYNGQVYGVIEDYVGCSSQTGPVFISIFDGLTLEELQAVDITDNQTEASGIAILPDTDEAVVSSYCDGKKLYVYRMSDWSLSRTIPLTISVLNIQGVAYRQGFLYIADATGRLYGLNLSDNSMRLLLKATMPGEYEGIDFHSGELRWLLNTTSGTHVLYRYAPF